MRTKDHERLALAVLKQFRLIYGSVRHHFRTIEETCGVSGSQLWLLQEVRKEPGRGISSLAAKLSIHQSTCSLLVQKLVAAGYLKRMPLITDRRRVGLALTRRGLAVLSRAPGPAEGMLPEALMALSDTRLKTLGGGLDNLIAQLQKRDHRDAGRPLADL